MKYENVTTAFILLFALIAFGCFAPLLFIGALYAVGKHPLIATAGAVALALFLVSRRLENRRERRYWYSAITKGIDTGYSAHYEEKS